MLSALIPFRAGDSFHDRNWAWTKRRWETLLPEVELVVEADDGGASPAEFNHPLALNRAAARAKGDVFVVADIDIVPDPDWIARAVDIVESSRAPWVVAERYLKVGQEATLGLLSSDPAEAVPPKLKLEEPPVLSSCAPPVVITREGFEASGGYDERISWWGGDDAIFRICTDTFWGPMERCSGDALHLWHPATLDRHEHQEKQHELIFAYADAAGDREAVIGVRFG